MSRKVTTEEFIIKAKNVHGDRYDYSLVNYQRCDIPVKIICRTHGIFEQMPSTHLNGSGCPKCFLGHANQNLRMSQEDFIKKSREIHGDKYDYSKVKYENSHTDVIIICPIHGEFKQRPYNHLIGRGCSKCGREVVGSLLRKTKEEFIEKANKVHNHKYDYSLIDYQGSDHKVKIICPVHGIFEQLATSHLQGSGCPLCGDETSGDKHRYSQKDFIDKAIYCHGNKYDYNKVVYKDCNTEVTITCPIHGDFDQIPTLHINGAGCPKCAIKAKADNSRLTNDQFIERAKNVHGDKYDYSKVDYYNNHTPVIIVCPEHGEFFVNPSSHLEGNGCPKCGLSIGENRILCFCEQHNIEAISQYRVKIIDDDGTTHNVAYDFYIPILNLLIEYQGMQHYQYNSYFYKTENDFLYRKHLDYLKAIYTIKEGYNFIPIPYWDLKHIDDILTELLLPDSSYEQVTGRL